MSFVTTTIPAELGCATPASAEHESLRIRASPQSPKQPPSRPAPPPTHRAEALHRLISGVHADVGDYCNLRDLLEAQFEAALRHDSARLLDIGKSLSRLVATLEGRRAARLALVQQLSLRQPATPATMLALFGDGPRQVAQALWHTLESLAHECRLINTRNARLLADQHTSLERVLSPRPAAGRAHRPPDAPSQVPMKGSS